MTQAAGTASADSSPASQRPTGASTDWEAEKARLQAEVSSRDNQIRALSQIKQAWEKNVGKELEGAIEYDTNGFPVGVAKAPARSFNGMHPLAASGVVDANTAQQYDDYLRQQLGSQFVTPQQLQAQVNAARSEAYNAAKGDFITLRNVDRTVADPKFKGLDDLTSPLAKKTEEVLTRNGWGKRLDPASQSWDQFQYAAPNALSIAAQIAKSELFDISQSSSQSTADAQTTQAAASIASGGGASTVAPAPSTEEMVRLFRDDPQKAEAIAKQQFDQSVGLGGR